MRNEYGITTRYGVYATRTTDYNGVDERIIIRSCIYCVYRNGIKLVFGRLKMTNHNHEQQNADRLQSVISDDLFPQVHHISDVKQVIEEMEGLAQNLREPQMK